MKRFPLYILAVWVMFGDHQIVKYPQAGQWQMSRSPYGDLRVDLENSMTGKVVVSLYSRKIRKIGFTMRTEANKYGYTVYTNPTIVHWPGMDYDAYNHRLYYQDPRIAHGPGEYNK
jgi:hypothetical protein